MKIELSDRFSKNTQISNFMQIRPVGAELLADGWTDRQTEITKLIVAFHNFANALKNGRIFRSRVQKMRIVF